MLDLESDGSRTFVGRPSFSEDFLSGTSNFPLKHVCPTSLLFSVKTKSC